MKVLDSLMPWDSEAIDSIIKSKNKLNIHGVLINLKWNNIFNKHKKGKCKLLTREKIELQLKFPN